MPPYTAMQSGLASEIERMEWYLRLCLRTKSVPKISALARDAAWAGPFQAPRGPIRLRDEAKCGTIRPTRILITEIPAET